MKLIFTALSIFFLTVYNIKAQTANAVSNDKYMFAESYTKNNYAASFTFRKSKKDEVESILNKYFDEPKYENNTITWRESKNDESKENYFFIELKKKELKMEWKNNIKTSHSNLIDRLKEITKEIIDTIK